MQMPMFKYDEKDLELEDYRKLGFLMNDEGEVD